MTPSTGVQKNLLSSTAISLRFMRREMVRMCRLVVLITDNPPSGFCDRAEYAPAVDGVRAHAIAQDARDASPCIKINAILVTGQPEPWPSNARAVMQDYATTACGWYSELPWNGDGVEEAVARMLYEAGACTCP